MLPRAAVRRHGPQRWRSLSTASDTPDHQRAPRHARPIKEWYPEENLKNLHPRMIFVRPWNGIQSMAHAFAIIREIERRFGKIQEFVVLRDSDVLTSNLPFMHATFAKASYADAIPLEGKVIQVTEPRTDPLRDGGVGLDDLEVYLDPVKRSEADEEMEIKRAGESQSTGPPDGRDVIDVKLERSGMREPPPTLDFFLGVGGRGPPHLRNSARLKELSEAMIAFGGFADTPLDSTGGRTRMQSVMSRWAHVAGTTFTPAPSPAAESHVPPADEVVWTPFSREGQPASAEPSPDSALPPTPPMSPSSSASPRPPLAKSTPPPKPKLKPVTPTLSKKQRVLLAARSAGAVTASQNDQGNLDAVPVSKGKTTGDGADMNTTDTSGSHSPADLATREENQQAARKWWSFLTGGKG